MNFEVMIFMTNYNENGAEEKFLYMDNFPLENACGVVITGLSRNNMAVNNSSTGHISNNFWTAKIVIDILASPCFICEIIQIFIYEASVVFYSHLIAYDLVIQTFYLMFHTGTRKQFSALQKNKQKHS